MRRYIFVCVLFILFVGNGIAFEYEWQINETIEGQESATVIQPVQVIILDDVVTLSDHSAAIKLRDKYSVHLGAEWSDQQATALLQTFESIPQTTNNSYELEPRVPTSHWHITSLHVQNDIEIEHYEEINLVTIAADAFVYANPLLAEIEGVRGRFFSRRLHRAVVRYVTDSGSDRHAVRQILKQRYDMSIDVPDYTELTRHTTGEHAGRFSEFKNEEILAIISMFEEYPQGMLKTPGLKYLVRRLDGLPHPISPSVAAVAWTGAGYIEFMESAFKGANYDTIYNIILHEKAHFLWEYLFDDQLKQDWIELGGWYPNPDDADGWSTTKQTEFVTAYAHGTNPDEDMAESIGFYIVRPDLLRSRSPAKYEFIQNRIMHGTRYISQIREDLTFQVYNLYPDYVYPGRIVRVSLSVEGLPNQDKSITIKIELHNESEQDLASSGYIRIFSDKGTFFDVGLAPVNTNPSILRGSATLSKYAAMGYWAPDQIRVWDKQGNERYAGQTDFGWKLYIDNPLADCEPPQYVPNSMRLVLSDAVTPEGKTYQILTATWEVIEASGIQVGNISLNDENNKTYSLFGYGKHRHGSNQIFSTIHIPNYKQDGTYEVNYIYMEDVANNSNHTYFTSDSNDEEPAWIRIETTNPDTTPPVLDINRITIKAEPTHPKAPNGETVVDIAFYVKDDISGYEYASVRLRDPQGVLHSHYHYSDNYSSIYVVNNPTTSKKYDHRIVLPVGSAPGTWGLSQMDLYDKAGNAQRYDFTEIVRFVVSEISEYDLNSDGKVNIQDLVLVANAIGNENTTADVNSDGEVNILDLVLIASNID